MIGFEKLHPLIKVLLSILFLALVLVPIFYRLGDFPLILWDEARPTMNALEMVNNGNYFNTFFEGKIDLWNTKPPLFPALVSIFIHLFGWNEWAVRMPSALATAGIIFTFLYFSKKYLHSYWIGALASLVLVSSYGFITFHVSRTADYDALLSFFTFAAALSFFLFVESKLKKQRYWYASVLLFVLACYTKGIAALLFFPGLLIYLIVRRQFIPLLKNPHFYIGGFLGAGSILFFYIYTELNNPGYLGAVFGNDMGGRFFSVNENNGGGFFYYFTSMLSKDFMPWFLLIIPSFFFIQKRLQLNKHLVWFLLICGFSFLFIISISSTKLSWYAAPVYPLFALLISYTLFEIYLNYNQFIPWNAKWKNGLAIIALVLLITPGYYMNWNKINREIPEESFNQVGSFFNEFADKHDNYFISKTGGNTKYVGNVDFYVEKARRLGKNVVPIYPNAVWLTNRILLCKESDKRIFSEKFTHRVIEEYHSCVLVEVVAAK